MEAWAAALTGRPLKIAEDLDAVYVPDSSYGTEGSDSEPFFAMCALEAIAYEKRLNTPRNPLVSD